MRLLLVTWYNWHDHHVEHVVEEQGDADGDEHELPLVLWLLHDYGHKYKEQKVYVVRLTVHASFKVAKKDKSHLKCVPPFLTHNAQCLQEICSERRRRIFNYGWPHLFTFPPIKGKWTSLMPMASPMSWLVLQTPLRLSLASAFWVARERSTGTHVPSEIETKL